MSGSQYFNDLWCFPLFQPGVPSLLDICAAVVRKHLDFEKVELPEELMDHLRKPSHYQCMNIPLPTLRK